MSNLDDLVAQLGYDQACEILLQHTELDEINQADVLTIVANRGVHHVPKNKLRGEIFYASEGNLDFSSQITVRSEIEKVLSNIARKLKSQNWKRIYIVPFGPNTLCMQIKLLVYRITRIESVDLFYTGSGEYIELEIRQRDIIVEV